MTPSVSPWSWSSSPPPRKLVAVSPLERRSPDAVEGAIAAFREAIKTDSGYAPGYTGLSGAYALHVIYGSAKGVDPYSATARALALVDRALSLDPHRAQDGGLRVGVGLRILQRQRGGAATAAGVATGGAAAESSRRSETAEVSPYVPIGTRDPAHLTLTVDGTAATLSLGRFAQTSRRTRSASSPAPAIRRT